LEVELLREEVPFHHENAEKGHRYEQAQGHNADQRVPPSQAGKNHNPGRRIEECQDVPWQKRAVLLRATWKYAD
jgi:hypothetical protein